MRKLILLSLCIVMFGLALGCDGIKTVKPDVHPISFYLVKECSTEEALKMAIDELPLELEPLFTDQVITHYIWKDHTFYFTDDFSLEKKLEGKVPLSGKPFVLMVEGKRIYMGCFWNMLSSFYLPVVPTINSIWSHEFDNQKYHINSVNTEPDPRNDPRIYEVLDSLGKIVF